MTAKKKSNQKPIRVCGECYHEYACFYAGGGCGNLTNTDATHCCNYETLTDILAKYAGIFGYKKFDDYCPLGERKEVDDANT